MKTNMKQIETAMRLLEIMKQKSQKIPTGTGNHNYNNALVLQDASKGYDGSLKSAKYAFFLAGYVVED